MDWVLSFCIYSLFQLGALQILPRISNISVMTGSLAGGQLVKIGGQGFGKVAADINVQVAGAPCKLLRVDSDAVTCITASGGANQRSVYRGGAGVKLDYFDEIQRTLHLC